MNESDSDPTRPARAAAEARKIAEYLDKRREFHTNRAAEFGYAKEVVEGVAWNLANSLDSPLIAATEESLTRFGEFVRNREAKVEPYSLDLYTLPSSAYALGSSTAASALAGVAVQNVKLPVPPPDWALPRIQEYADKLSEFSPDLGGVARSVWNSFYNDPDNGARSAMFTMRQVFDHLFSILAPDDKVRLSPFFKEKDREDPLEVHRPERMAYAAAAHVSDKTLADYLVSQSGTVLAIYKELNRAHTRGPLDRDRAKQTLSAMQAVIVSWVDAVRGSANAKLV